jgi:hypothetical protein
MKIYLEQIGFIRVNEQCAVTRKGIHRFQANQHRLGMRAFREFFARIDNLNNHTVHGCGANCQLN